MSSYESDDKKEMSLKEKCYSYQKEVNYFLDPDKYIIAHIDGRGFSNLIKNKFEKPFDDAFIHMMNETAKFVCKEVQGCILAYTQSDEISLIIRKNEPEGDVFFGGRMCKMQSIIASLATSEFNRQLLLYHMEKSNGSESIELLKNTKLAQFDCKVWNVDTANDAVAWILFRNIDCVRNSKQQACQTYLPHKILMSKNTDEQIEILKTTKGVDWHKFSEDKKFGRLIKKTIEVHKMSDGEEYERSRWKEFPFYDMTNKDNRENFINEFNLKDNEDE